MRYADDFVICVAGTRQHAEALVAETAQVLRPLGLTLSLEKTRITHIDEGVDFLGWRVKRDRDVEVAAGVYMFPSKAALASVKAKIKEITRSGTNQSLDQLLHRLNPVLRGWCAYFRSGSVVADLQYLRHYTWRRVVGWLRRKYPKRQLALAATPPPPGLVADRRGHGALQPGGGQHHPLPLPGRAHRDSLAVRTDRLARATGYLEQLQFLFAR